MTLTFRSSSHRWCPSIWPTYNSSSTAPRISTSVSQGGGGADPEVPYLVALWFLLGLPSSVLTLRFGVGERGRLKSAKNGFMKVPLKWAMCPCPVFDAQMQTQGSLCQAPPPLLLCARTHNSTWRQSGNGRCLPRGHQTKLWGRVLSCSVTSPFPSEKKKCCYLRNLLTSLLLEKHHLVSPMLEVELIGEKVSVKMV